MNIPIGGIFSKVTLGVFLLIVMTFVYIAADWIYGPYSQMVRNVMIIYFILFLLVMAAFKTGMPLIGTSLIEIRGFALGFILTALLLLFMPLGGFAGEINMTVIKMALGFGILHGFIKAYIEEATFRGILLNKIGMIPSNILFGCFHIGVVILSLTSTGVPVTFTTVAVPVALLTGLGFAWSFIAKRFGLMAAVGSHLAYNLKVFGVLERVVGL